MKRKLLAACSKGTCILLLLVVPTLVFSQESVTTVAYGTGTTKDKAINNALRAAIEKTIGGFISTNTQVINEEIISDEMLVISQGNIQAYDIVSIQESSNEVKVTISAKVSLQKILQTLNGKGFEAKYKGNLAMQNILIEEYYTEQEPIALLDFLETWQGVFFFDYKIDQTNPTPFRLTPETIKSKIAFGDIGTYIKRKYVMENKSPAKFQFFEKGNVSQSDLNTYWGIYSNNYSNSEYLQVTPFSMHRDFIESKSGLSKIQGRAWTVEMRVLATPNINYNNYFESLLKLLKNISISESTKKFREESGLDVYGLYNEVDQDFIFFRNPLTLEVLLKSSINFTNGIYSYKITDDKGTPIDYLQQISRGGIMSVNEVSGTSDPSKPASDSKTGETAKKLSNYLGRVIENNTGVNLNTSATSPSQPRGEDCLEKMLNGISFRDYYLPTLDIFTYFRPFCFSDDYRPCSYFQGAFIFNDFRLKTNKVIKFGMKPPGGISSCDNAVKLEDRFYYASHRVFHIFDAIEEISELQAYRITPTIVLSN